MPDTSSFPRTVFATLFASPQLFSHLLYHLIASFVCTLGNMAPKQQRVMESDEETMVLSPSCQANRDPPSPAPAVSDDPRDVPPGGFVILSDGTTAGTMPDSMMNPYTMSIINNMMGLLNRGSSSNNLGGNGDSQVSPVAVFVGNNSGQYMEMNKEMKKVMLMMMMLVLKLGRLQHQVLLVLQVILSRRPRPKLPRRRSAKASVMVSEESSTAHEIVA